MKNHLETVSQKTRTATNDMTCSGFFLFLFYNNYDCNLHHLQGKGNFNLKTLEFWYSLVFPETRRMGLQVALTA